MGLPSSSCSGQKPRCLPFSPLPPQHQPLHQQILWVPPSRHSQNLITCLRHPGWAPSPSALDHCPGCLTVSVLLPLPLTCLHHSHQTHLAKCKSRVSLLSCAPGPTPLLSWRPIHSSPLLHSFSHLQPTATPHSPSRQSTHLLVLSVRPGQCFGHQGSAVPPVAHPGGLQGGGVLVDRAGCLGWGHRHSAHQNLRLLQGCLGSVQGAECYGPQAGPALWPHTLLRASPPPLPPASAALGAAALVLPVGLSHESTFQ